MEELGQELIDNFTQGEYFQTINVYLTVNSNEMTHMIATKSF